MFFDGRGGPGLDGRLGRRARNFQPQGRTRAHVMRCFGAAGSDFFARHRFGRRIARKNTTESPADTTLYTRAVRFLATSSETPRTHTRGQTDANIRARARRVQIRLPIIIIYLRQRIPQAETLMDRPRSNGEGKKNTRDAPSCVLYVYIIFRTFSSQRLQRFCRTICAFRAASRIFFPPTRHYRRLRRIPVYLVRVPGTRFAEGGSDGTGLGLGETHVPYTETRARDRRR